jgi:hypothetical protein
MLSPAGDTLCRNRTLVLVHAVSEQCLFVLFVP